MNDLLWRILEGETELEPAITGSQVRGNVVPTTCLDDAPSPSAVAMLVPPRNFDMNTILSIVARLDETPEHPGFFIVKTIKHTLETRVKRGDSVVTYDARNMKDALGYIPEPYRQKLADQLLDPDELKRALKERAINKGEMKFRGYLV